MKPYAVLLFLLLHFAQPLAAFELTYTCDSVNPCEEGQKAIPVKWFKQCVGYYINERGSRDLEKRGEFISDAVLEVVETSFKSWNDVSDTAFQMNYAGLTDVSSSEGIDGNTISWQDERWPYATKRALALTLVSFEPDTGEIIDADIQFNGVHALFEISESPTKNKVDFQGTLTHEIGHFVGLDHSKIKEATMFGSAKKNEVSMRTLHNDDKEGLRSLYPSTRAGECEDLPDFLSADLVDEGCCSTYGRDRTLFPIVILLLFGVFLKRKKA